MKLGRSGTAEESVIELLKSDEMSALSMTRNGYIYARFEESKPHTHNPKSTKYNFVSCEADFLESIAVPDNSEIHFKTMYNKSNNNVDQLKI